MTVSLKREAIFCRPRTESGSSTSLSLVHCCFACKFCDCCHLLLLLRMCLPSAEGDVAEYAILQALA